MEALESEREIELRNGEGLYTTNVLHQIRQDGDDRWVFLCRGSFPYNKDISRHFTLKTKVKGEWNVRLYDTQTGEISAIASEVKNGWTYITAEMYDYDSFLYRLSPVSEDFSVPASAKTVKSRVAIPSANLVPFELLEPNALLLDMAEYSLDGEPYNEREEILAADTICRKRLGWAVISGNAAQPWCIEKEPVTHSIKLRFTVNSEIRVYGAMLAIENPDRAEILWNGEPLSTKARGWYVDRSIKTVRIPVINKGTNVLELTLPFGKRTTTEWCYIIGNFGTRVIGSEATIVPMANTLGYGSIVPQTLSFYSGAIDYKLDITIPEECDTDELMLTVPQYRGSLVEVFVDGEPAGDVVYPPYKLSLGNVGAGAHEVTLRLYVPRTNGFGPVHVADEEYAYPGPKAWRVEGEEFGYEYHFHTEGITMKPWLECVKY